MNSSSREDIASMFEPDQWPTLATAARLVEEWSDLLPHAAARPADARAFALDVREALEAAMTRVLAGRGEGRALAELLDATYVLERLHWCVLHGVPYVDRPRVPLVA